MSKFTWNEEVTATLTNAVAGLDVVSQEKLAEIAETLGTSTRSVGAKLRKLGHVVQSASESKKSTWDESEEAALATFLNQNAGVYTYGEVASVLLNGKFNAKQIQGKVLSMQLTHLVKPTPKKEAARTFTEAEEATFVSMANAGASLEDVAGALGKTVPQVRGKALSLFREARITAIPKQAVTAEKAGAVDPFEGLNVAELTVAELAENTERTERGIRTMLTRRGLVAKDYDGEARAKKLSEKADK